MKQKTSLHYTIIACLLLSAESLHAAFQQSQTEAAVYDYTSKQHLNVFPYTNDEDDSKDDEKQQSTRYNRYARAWRTHRITLPHTTRSITSPVPPSHTTQKLKSDLLPHFLAHPSRILWEGTTILLNLYKPLQNQKKVYCIVTDDDTLYLLHKKPIDKNAPKLYTTIDLATYGFISKEKNDSFILSSINPYVAKATVDNTLCLQNQYSKPKGSLFHLLRYATHQYYYLTKKQLTLFPLQAKSVLDEKKHQLIQCTCEVIGDSYRQAHMYCLFPKSYKTTYQSLADLLEKYLHTDVLSLAKPTKATNLRNNESPLYWENRDDRAFTLTLASTMQHDTTLSDIKKKIKPKKPEQWQAAQQLTLPPSPVQEKQTLPAIYENQPTIPCPYLSLSSAPQKSTYQAMQCEIYVAMYKHHKLTQDNLTHLQVYAHASRPPCKKQSQCAALQRILHNNAKNNEQYLKDLFHWHLFAHPTSAKPKASKQISKAKPKGLSKKKQRHAPNVADALPEDAANYFTAQEDFGQMYPLDLRAQNPLDQLVDPRQHLKALLQEFIKNDRHPLTEEADCWLALFGIHYKHNHYIPIIEAVKYLTSNELPWLKENVEDKIRVAHLLGYPLNVVEIAALALYTEETNFYTDLGNAQRNNNFDKWPLWDHYLMRAIFKLHHSELANNKKPKRTLYSGLENVQIKQQTQIGFFKSYTSTTPNIGKAQEFKGNGEGMMMFLQPKMSTQFLNGDVSWISPFSEQEILFARSADIGVHPAPKWKAAVVQKDYLDATTQAVEFTPFLEPLIIQAGETLELPLQSANALYEFSYIKLEPNATLTIAAWDPLLQQGGLVRIHCAGDCILAADAKIDLSSKGYAGGTQQHPQGYGEGGGNGSSHCAAGGSHITKGSIGKCKGAFYAQPTSTYGHTPAFHMPLLGSGGGCIQYNSQESASGSRGGGALYLEIMGHLHLGKNAQLLANGGNAHPLSGGAGSGGSLCIAVQGKLILTQSPLPYFVAEGGHNEQSSHPTAQGKGGTGNIILYIAQYEKILCHWFRTFPRNTFSISHTQLKDYRELITALLLHPSPSFMTKQLPLSLKIPHFIAMHSSYYNAKGVMCRKKAQYVKALAYHEKALKLQTKLYGNKAIYPAVAKTYGHKGETLAAQGNYLAAITAHQEELRIAQAWYQKTNAAHPKLLQAYTHLSSAYHGQGQDTEAMQYLDKAIQVSKKDKPNKEIADAYDTRGLLHRSQGNYKQAMQDYRKAADIRKQLYSQKAHFDTVTSYKRIGQTYHAQGNNTAAIASYRDGLKMWQKLYRNQPHYFDGAAIYALLGDAYHSLGQYKHAITYQEKALCCYNETYAKQNHPDIADTLLRLGQSYHSQGDYDLATYYYQKAIQMLRTVYKQQDTLDTLFSYLIQQGISQQNVELWEQWLAHHNFDDEALLEDLQGCQADANIATYYPTIYSLLKQFLQEEVPATLDEPFHPAIADALEQQGNAYLYFGNTTKALQNHQKAYAMRQLAYSNLAHPKRIASYNSIARFHLYQKKYEQALQILNKGIHAWKEQYGTRAHPSIALTYRLRGLVYHNQTNCALARQEHQTSLSMHKKLYGENPHPAIADDYHAIANTYAKEGKYKENALPCYKKALEIRQKIYHDIPYHPSIAASLSAIGTTYAAIGESDQAIESHVQATRCQLQHFRKATQIDDTLTFYVPTDASRAKALEEEAFPLHPRVKQFIHHPDNTVLLLHGDAGAGKSLYGRFLEDKLWSNYQKNSQSIIPLFVSLPALQDPIHHAVTETLVQYGWDNTTIQALQQQNYHLYSQNGQQPDDDSKDDEKTDIPSSTPRLLVFLDGYDEINATQNLYQTNQLAQWGAKVIIGCRTEYLDQLDNYRQYFQANTELYIRPFNPQQIDTYLDRIETTKQANAMQTTWRKDQYKAIFKEMPTLQALSTSPFLLQLIVTALPHLPNRTQITRADIYHTFIEQWITNAVNRMAQQGMENISRTACWQYGMEVALFMFLHARVTIQASTTSFKETGLCNHFSKDKKECPYTGAPFFAEAHTLLRKALPLKQLSNTTSSFLHKSLQEYCAAQALLQSVAQPPRSSNELTTYFTKEVKAYDPITNKNSPALNQKLLNRAPAIIHFLVDALAPTAQYPAWEEWLFAIIEASKKNSAVAIAAANSATILNAGGILLHDKDWAGIHIPYALLDHAFLARTNLQGAHLMGVSLRKAYLEDAQLQKANVHYIHFGEYPMLLHTSGVKSVHWSPDGKRVASASDDNSVRIWEVATGKLLQQCDGHTNRVKSVHWSPDGTRLASASKDKSVRIWEVATGKLLQLCDGHTDQVNSVHWSPDGKRLASASGSTFGNDNSVHIWEVATGKLLQLCDGHTSGVMSVSWSPDGTRLASASGSYGDNSDNSVRIWDVATGKQIQQCAGHTYQVKSVHWSPDGKNVASASKDKSVRIWEVATGKLLQLCDGHTSYVYSVHWSPDGTRLASASDDKSVRIWEVATGKPLQQCDGHTRNVNSVHWSPDGKRLASASDDKGVRFWEVATSNALQPCAGHTSAVHSVHWSPDGKRLASASSDKSVRIWEVATGKLLQRCDGHTWSVKSVHWSPDGTRVASASWDKSVRIWEVATGKLLQLCDGHASYVNSVHWSPDGTRFASASGSTFGNDNRVRIWEVATGKLLQLCDGHTSAVHSVSWSPDGNCLASASGDFKDDSDNSVRIWEVATGKLLQLCDGHTYQVNSVHWSPDGKRVASASDDKSVRIWEVATGKLLQRCTGYTSIVTSVHWSPDGKHLVSASDDNSVRIWEVATGKQIQLCDGHTDNVKSVHWSPDGKHLASASKDKSVRIWEVAAGKQIQQKGGVKKGKVVRIISNSPFLTFTDTNFTGAIGLSSMYKRLVRQRGGIV